MSNSIKVNAEQFSASVLSLMDGRKNMCCKNEGGVELVIIPYLQRRYPADAEGIRTAGKGFDEAEGGRGAEHFFR